MLKNPESPSKIGQVEMAIASHIEDHPDDLSSLQEMYAKIEEKKGSRLTVENIKSQGNIDVKAKQDNSSADIRDIESRLGGINIDINQK